MVVTMAMWTRQRRAVTSEKIWGGMFEVTEEDVKVMDQFEEDVPQTHTASCKSPY